MAAIIKVSHAETGSSTTIGCETAVDCLLAAIEWLGGEIAFIGGKN